LLILKSEQEGDIMRNSLIILSAILSISLGTAFIQTDWSGGPGIAGPVTEWGNYYSSSSQVFTEYERIQLGSGELIPYPEPNIIENYWFCNAFDFPAPEEGCYAHMVSLGPYSTVLFWENSDGTGSWNVHTVGSIGEDWLAAMAGFDADGDGDADMVGVGDDEVYFWENTGLPGSWPRGTITEVEAEVSCILAEDMDIDDDQDLLVCGVGIKWYELAGQNWITHTVTPEGYFICETDDIDSDGDIDLAAYGNALIWFQNQSSTDDIWTAHTIAEDLPYLLDIATGDLDGNGYIDIITGQLEDESGGYIIWWKNIDGTGEVFTPCTLSTEGAKDMVVSDLDLDGDLDIASMISFGDLLGEGYTAIQWHENNGEGQFTEHPIWESTEYFWELCTRLLAADTDCDGAVELYTSLPGSFDQAFIEFKLMGFQSMGCLESSILDAGSEMSWNLFQYTVQEQTGDQVSFQVRSSSNPDEMGPWSPPFTTASTSIAGMTEDSTRYFQYRLDLEGGSPETSPVLYDVTVSCDYTGTGTSPANNFLIEPLSNPCHHGISLEVISDAPRQLSLELIDISGRILSTRSETVSEGYNLFNFTELMPGMYFCLAESGGEKEILRIMVVD